MKGKTMRKTMTGMTEETAGKIARKMKGEKTNLLVFLVIFAFLLSYFTPELILKDTTIAGGDTSSQYIYADYMKNYLLPNWKVSGWFPGAYAGFPVFQFYFFPPFLLAAIMGYVIPLTVAFKIVTILGIFSLPPAAFFAMRFMRFGFPAPIIAAAFTLPFLFMEANSMWGGNIPSTLAGEFSNSISLSLVVLFIGLIFRSIEDKKGHNAAALLLVLVILTHVYTALFAVLTSSFFLLTRNRDKLRSNLKFLAWVFLVSFLLVGFWILPLVSGLAYTTPYSDAWKIQDIKDVFPQIFYPFYFFAIFGLYRSLQRRENGRREEGIFFICYSILTAAVLFVLAPKLGVVNIRFIPFIQLLILPVSAYGLAELVRSLKGNWVIPLIVITATIMWVNYNVTFIPTWIEWNYEGFEDKPLWGAYSDVNEFLKGNENDPRVVYEHSALHNAAGSVRAFESLPYFSGRSTLEGLYMQSTITSPFVFIIQSEISKAGSCPFKQWPCPRFDPTRAARHLETFNVREVVAVSNEVKTALKKNKNYKLVASFPPYEIYELLMNRDRYVVVPDYEPVLFETEHWKEDSYIWFLRSGDVPLVFEGPGEEKFKLDTLETSDLDDVPRVPVENDCSVQSTLKNEEIFIKTDCVGKPHVIRVSYSPNWKVEGASGIYLVSPSFMLIYPEKEDVRLYYGRTAPGYLGLIFSLIGVLLLIFNKRWRRKFDGFIDANLRYLIIILIILAAAVLMSNSLSSEKWDRGEFIAEVGVSFENHVICETIKSRDTRDGCFKDVAIANGDSNLCDVKVESRDVKDECFKGVGIAKNDFNLCNVRIKDREIKDECFKEIGIKTNDYNLCAVKIMDERLKKECRDGIAAKGPAPPGR